MIIHLMLDSRSGGCATEHLDHERAKGREIAKHEGREGNYSGAQDMLALHLRVSVFRAFIRFARL